jgi:hypothetical protein
MEERIAKHQWEIDPDDVKRPTIHGIAEHRL